MDAEAAVTHPDDTGARAGAPGDPTPPREALIGGIVGQLQGLSLVADQIGAAFASRQSLAKSDFRALTAIHRAERDGHPLTGGQLAHELHLTPAAVSYLVDRLAESGHVWRDPDPHDRRRVRLRIGEKGLEVATAFFGPLRHIHEDALAGYSTDDLALCVRFLADVNASLTDFGRNLPE